ncbi:ABC transporter permease [Varunaivibrio sulfuroxidans]|uniref:Iron(III) transport system permease protein n=1 Tax=Varunaivibrio sulfuroxidans TaxID=1773489 RepID=A0A4R3JDN8_9PROT|nr:iron ABC transporter permease [Varunaivibrio sulfuroxidans]TCS64169.1 iron(III) transport system permease protein [Varunaivibrio sulfuroxidans]WES31385.1 iron ABC transporter permease [Varunaivibrio sulfuroxidans]
MIFSPQVREEGRNLRPAFFFLSTTVLAVIVGLPVLAIVAFAVFPDLNALSFAAPFSALAPSLRDARLTGAIARSLELSSAVTAVCVVIALPLAYLRVRITPRWGRVWDGCFLVPFLIPPYIGSLAWMQLLQRNGFMQQVSGLNLDGMLYSFWGMVLVMALHLFALIYFAAAKSFALIGRRYGDAAKVFGARALSLFWRIHLPMTVPAVLSSALIVFVLTIEEFGTPAILGNRFGYEVIVTLIHEKFTDWPIDLSGASVLSMILIAIAFVAYQGNRALSKKFESRVENQILTAPGDDRSRRFQVLVNMLFAGVFFLAVALPVATVTIMALMNTVSGGVTWSNLSLAHLVGLFEGGSAAWRAILTSVTLAISAAVLTVLIGLLVAFSTVRMRFRGSAALDFLSILPSSIPGMAVAVGLILTWNLPFWPVTPYNTPVVLLLAYLCLMLPYPIRLLTGALRQLPRSLDDAAYVSGASEFTLVVRVLSPLLGPVALAAGLIVFAISTRELVSSIMLAPPGVETVATYVFNQFNQGSIGSGMAMSLVAIVFSGAIIALGQGLYGGRQGGPG